MLKSIYVFAVILLISSCTTTKQAGLMSSIQDAQLKEVLTKALDAMGGYENWNNIKSLQFQKKITLYDASGTIEKTTDQKHVYTFQPENKVNITWTEEGVVNEMIMENGEVRKLKNGQIDTEASLTSLKNSIYASTFVIGVPFKLLDEGAQLSYEGTKMLASGKKVHVIKAVYNPAAYKKHTKADVWWHYFDEQSYQQLGYTVQLHDHSSYIENLSFDRVDGFLFTATRNSWLVDANGNNLYVKAGYEYGKYEVN